MLDLQIGLLIARAKQFGDKGYCDERVQVHVQPVEHPPEPRGDAGSPLGRRQIGKPPDFVHGRGWIELRSGV